MHLVELPKLPEGMFYMSQMFEELHGMLENPSSQEILETRRDITPNVGEHGMFSLLVLSKPKRLKEVVRRLS